MDTILCATCPAELRSGFRLDQASAPVRCTPSVANLHPTNIQKNWGVNGGRLATSSPLSYPAVTADIVSRLCEQGKLSEAVEALGVLVHTESVVSSSVLYTVLRKCVGKKDLVRGRRVHALTVKSGYESDTFLCNHFLRMYAGHAMLEEAMEVFSVVAEPDAFTWSAIISAHVKHGQDKLAIELYHRMYMSGVKPDGYVFVAALQACGRAADLEAGQQVHADALACGVGTDLFVCNGLVDMYAKCGSLEDAQRVFDGLGHKDVVTWTVLISGYSQRGMGQEALDLYSAMEEEGIAAPDSVTFVSLLQACASVGVPALEKGKQLHAKMGERGIKVDVVVGGSLVNMYVKCGSLEDARGVFDGLGQKSVVTWTALIAGYSEQGMGEEALSLHRAVQQEGMAVSNPVTFVCLLRACASVGAPALERGKQLHAQITQGGFQADVLVGGSLVNMYAKCGSLEDAQRLFDRLPQKDVVTWTALIGGYSYQGKGQEALRLFCAMQEAGMDAFNSVTIVCLLQACASLGMPGLENGKHLHAKVRERGLLADVRVGNSLVNMYAKCGSLEAAQNVFDRLDRKDEVSWNAMIAGYSQQGMAHEALHLYTTMREEGIVAPTSVTYVCALQACATVGNPALEMGKQLHSEIGDQADEVVCCNLVNMYAKCGSLEAAQAVFDRLGQKSVITWTALIAGYSQQGRGQEALRLYSAMQLEGIVEPDSVTFVCLLHACASVGTLALEAGQQLHAQIGERGLQNDVHVANNLVNMYAKCGSLQDARFVFHRLGEKNVVSWNAIIAGYSQQGMGQEALCLYNAMKQEGITVPDTVTFVCLLQACAAVGIPALETGKQLHAQIQEQGLQNDVFLANSLVNMYAKCGSLGDARRMFDKLFDKSVVTWNAMIAGYTQQGMGQEALHLYMFMQEENIVAADSVTFACLLQACADVGALHVGRELHSQIEAHGLQVDAVVAISLMNMYAKSGSMVDAQQVFDGLPKQDPAAWNALISGYACQGDSEVVFNQLRRMKEAGIQPAGSTFLSVLTVCSHAGLVTKGRECFESMSRDYGMSPTSEHYRCLVDLLSRAGHLDEALAVVRTMPVLPDAAVWHTLLSACRKWTNVEVGRIAFDEAVNLDEKDAAAYVLMSSIYSSAQMWEQAQEMQATRIGTGAWKQPGQSWWTDLEGLVHSFSVGDRSLAGTHPRREEFLFHVKEKGALSHLDHAQGHVFDYRNEHRCYPCRWFPKHVSQGDHQHTLCAKSTEFCKAHKGYLKNALLHCSEQSFVLETYKICPPTRGKRIWP